MSIPFLIEVAAAAVEMLTAPNLPAVSPVRRDFSETPAEMLCKQFPKQHPLLISEHIAYASMLIQASQAKAQMLRAGAITSAEAIRSLTTSFTGFPVAAIEKALEFAMSDGSSDRS
jgi:tRNA A37 threonylcarbamoyladenosine synthetase subunit TsaC/SUA5/YrdC